MEKQVLIQIGNGRPFYVPSNAVQKQYEFNQNVRVIEEEPEVIEYVAGIDWEKVKFDDEVCKATEKKQFLSKLDELGIDYKANMGKKKLLELIHANI